MTRRAGGLVVGVLLLAACAQVSVPVPGTPVPQSLQTLAVVLVGAWLGAGWGAAAVLAYVALGAAGLPVFADGAGGVEHLFGPTAGYLVGFVVGAAGMGWWLRRGDDDGSGFVRCAAGAVAAHALILGLGWLRLAMIVGVAAAWAEGVEPFVVGGIAKSVVAAAVLVVGSWRGGKGVGAGDTAEWAQ